MKNSKKWSIATLCLALAALLMCAAVTAVVDPFFHYHGPLARFQYPINNQRYQNDGIARHFSYDALITGTSLTENFKASEFDALFDVHSVKMNYSGGSFEEIFSNLEQAVRCNPELKLVLFGLDEWFLLDSRELIQANGEYPTYLYDNNPFNDVNYLLNREVLLNNVAGVLFFTKDKCTTTSFDEYGSWESASGTEQVLAKYNRDPIADQQKLMTPQDYAKMEKYFQETILRLAEENPQITFIYFFPPYSMLTWDMNLRQGTARRQLASYEEASRMLVDADNIQLYSFCTDFDTITNLDNYTDATHYIPAINSLILERIAKGEYRLTKDNYREHWQQVEDFYFHYDYDAFLEAHR